MKKYLKPPVMIQILGDISTFGFPTSRRINFRYGPKTKVIDHRLVTLPCKSFYMFIDNISYLKIIIRPMASFICGIYGNQLKSYTLKNHKNLKFQRKITLWYKPL